MKTLIIHGGPREDGNSSTMARHFANGLRETGRTDIKEYRLYGMDIFPCRGCRHCQSAPAAGCAIRDDMTPVYDAWKTSRCIVMASPIYWWHVTGPVKSFLDRMTPLQYRDDPTYLRGKTLLLILSYGFDSPTGNQLVVRMFEDIAQWGGMDFHHVGFCSGAGDVWDHPEKLLEVEKLGREIGSKGLD